MSELPMGWVNCRLDDLLDNIQAGKSVRCDERPPQSDEPGLVKISAVTWGRFDETESKTLLSDEILDERNHIQKGDLLISRANTLELVGAPVIVHSITKNLYLSDKVLRLDMPEGLRAWALTCLRSESGRKQIQAAATGNQLSMRNISQEALRSIEMPLPPLAEQARIADKLDSLLAQVDTLKTRLDALPALIKRFRQSVLAAAVSGKLTEDWRLSSKPTSTGHQLNKLIKAAHDAEGGHVRGNASSPTEEAHDLTQEELPTSWDIANLRDICAPGRPITYGILKPGPELTEGVPYIRVADFPGNKLNQSTIKKTSPEIDAQFKRSRLKAGDLLLSIRGSVGRIIKIPENLGGTNITQDTARLSISSMISSDYAHLVLLAPSTQRRMKNATRGVAVRGINIGDVRALQIPLPPSCEQHEIVRRVEQLFAFADQLETRLNDARKQVDNLTQSILAKAFRGELVPQDPSDDPASALLARISAQRAAAPKPKRGRKAAASKA